MLVCHYLKDVIWDEVDPPPRPMANMPSARVKGKLYWMVDAQLGPSSSGVEIIELDVSKRKFEVLQGMKFVPVLFQESLVNPCHSTV
jgi:hypothetical protein